MKITFCRYREACWFNLPVFDFFPFLSVTVQHKETLGIKYGWVVKFGWLIFQYRLEGIKVRGKGDSYDSNRE